jgi:hypothetical protein
VALEKFVFKKVDTQEVCINVILLNERFFFGLRPIKCQERHWSPLLDHHEGRSRIIHIELRINIQLSWTPHFLSTFLRGIKLISFHTYKVFNHHFAKQCET